MDQWTDFGPVHPIVGRVTGPRKCLFRWTIVFARRTAYLADTELIYILFASAFLY